MKFTVNFALMLFLTLVLIGGLCAIGGCASTRDQKGLEQQTMYDFIGGGKPEFNGNKY